jgi:hypothetical protein
MVFPHSNKDKREKRAIIISAGERLKALGSFFRILKIILIKLSVYLSMN